jgi:myo-inositol-1(or 4)-monophosphatase
MSAVERPGPRQEDVVRIREALVCAGEILRRFCAARVGVSYKAVHSPVTDADLAVDAVLRRELPDPDEGWLSEESVDSPERLERRRVWVVDPLDGTREFLDGVPQWGVSIGLVEDGEAVAGGIYIPATDEMFLGSRETGVTLNGEAVRVSTRATLDGATVVTNRWALKKRPRQFMDQPFRVRVVNAMAYSLALIAAGQADALWSHSPKAEWDTAAGAALIMAAGGRVTSYDGARLRFNEWPPRSRGIIATNGVLHRAVQRHLR